MKKEDWIQNVLETAGKINKADADPFLYDRINNRLKSNPSIKNFVPDRMIARLTVGFAMLIVVNVFSIGHFNSHSGRNDHSEATFYNTYFSNYNYNY